MHHQQRSRKDSSAHQIRRSRNRELSNTVAAVRVTMIVIRTSLDHIQHIQE